MLKAVQEEVLFAMIYNLLCLMLKVAPMRINRPREWVQVQIRGILLQTWLAEKCENGKKKNQEGIKPPPREEWGICLHRYHKGSLAFVVAKVQVEEQE